MSLIEKKIEAEFEELDARDDHFETLVPIDHPYGIWVKDYIDWYAVVKNLDVSTPENKSRLSRFIKAKILGGISLHKISLVDMGRIVFAPYHKHQSFSYWLSNQEYNPNIQDNTQEIIENVLSNRKWYEDRTGIKFEASTEVPSLCSSENR